MSNMIGKIEGGDRGGGVRMVTIAGKGCSRLFPDFSSSFRGIPSFLMDPLSPISSGSIFSNSPAKTVISDGPFSGLVICVTGLSKETRKQVKEATERLGGQYSPHLCAQCTHLVVQSFHGRKYEHALKHGQTNGLFVVTIGWFVDSVKKNVRLDEALYSVNKTRGSSASIFDSKRIDPSSAVENSCLPTGQRADITEPSALHSQRRDDSKRHNFVPSFSGQFFYVDVGVPSALRSKVVEAITEGGGTLLNHWFAGCNVHYVVCEGASIQKYLGHSNNIVTPLWVLKYAKEHSVQRFFTCLSVDLARFVRAQLDDLSHGASSETVTQVSCSNATTSPAELNHEERRMKVKIAKDQVRKRRNRRMQMCETPIRPITPCTLLDSIRWSISEPTSTACVYTETSTVHEASDDATESSFVNSSRPLTESEKTEVAFGGHFLTILFPVDRFSETGPRSRTFISHEGGGGGGFTRLRILDHVHSFYQEDMSPEEIEMGIQTDSRHADRLRAAYETAGPATRFRRVDFVGSRKCFEMLKRVPGDNECNVYELLIRP